MFRQVSRQHFGSFQNITVHVGTNNITDKAGSPVESTSKITIHLLTILQSRIPFSARVTYSSILPAKRGRYKGQLRNRANVVTRNRKCRKVAQDIANAGFPVLKVFGKIQGLLRNHIAKCEDDIHTNQQGSDT